METLYVCGEADISRDENTILVKTRGIKKRVPIEAVRHIVVMSTAPSLPSSWHSPGAPVSVSRSSIIVAGSPEHSSRSRILVPAK